MGTAAVRGAASSYGGGVVMRAIWHYIVVPLLIWLGLAMLFLDWWWL